MDIEMIKLLADYTMKYKDNSKYGLFDGLPGNCIFFYELSRSLNIKKYEIIADDLLDKICSSSKQNELKPNLGYGVAGVGLCIEYLLRRGFCKGNRDEILEDIDVVVFRAISESAQIPFGLSDGLTGYLFYIISRLENNIQSDSFIINAELFKTSINKIDRIFPDHFHFMTKDVTFDMFGVFPVLFCLLAKSLELNIYNVKIINVVKQWTLYIETLMPSLQSNRLRLAISLFKLNSTINLPEIEKQIKVLLYSIDFDKLIQECNLNSLNINFGWMGQAFLLKTAGEIFKENYPNFDHIEPTRREIVNVCNERYSKLILKAIAETDEKKKPKTGLMDGLSGIGLMYLLYSECFE
jgi:lantibiotic modifying enzyme